MNEIDVLAELLKHADEQINLSITVFMTVLGIVATFSATKTYNENFNWILKFLLSIGLTILLIYNRDTIIEQMIIYNKIISNFPLEREPWKTLFGYHGVYHKLSTTQLYWVHASSSWIIHLLIWNKELKNMMEKFVTNLRNSTF